MATALPILAVEHVSRAYPGVRALRGVSLDLRRGEVHALVGENGAGKSTLIRVLSGDVKPDSGSIEIEGQPTVFERPRDARQHGIVTIFQELMIVPDLSVAENIFLGNEPGRRSCIPAPRPRAKPPRSWRASASDRRSIRPNAPAISRPPSAAHRDSTCARVARARHRDGRAHGGFVGKRGGGAAPPDRAACAPKALRFLYVSHRLDEVMEIADRMTVLRGGERVATKDASKIKSTSELIGLMVGRPMAELFPLRNEKIGDVVFSVSGLTRHGVFTDINFDVRAGEVARLCWPHRRRSYRGHARDLRRRPARCGRDPQGWRGDHDPTVRATPLRAASPTCQRTARTQGLVLTMSGAENVVMASLDHCCVAGFVSRSAIRKTARATADRLQFKGQLACASRHVVRRQSAKARHRQVYSDRGQGSHLR